MKFLTKACDFLESLFVQLMFALMVIMVLTLFIQVINRFLLQWSLGWTQEVAIYSLFWLVMIGMSVALRRNIHLTVDFILTKLNQSYRRYYQIGIHVVLIYILSIILYQGIGFTFKTGTSMLSPGIGIKLLYIYAALPIASAISILFLIHNIMKLWLADSTDQESISTPSAG